MRCPFCGHEDTQVKDSRPTDDNSAIRRRRYCPSCGSRFTTFERVQLRELTWSRRTASACSSTATSSRARSRWLPQAPGRSRAGRAGGQRHRARLESSGESEIPSTQIGELVMDALRALDPVAYVRFASVYRNFREAKDFRGVHLRPRRDQPQGLSDDARGARAGAPVARPHPGPIRRWAA
jgi:Predicted transcriptional regulator, consists of a Zn-ribbon and ATP-cone domains